jgi:hypothetical protein
VTCYLACFEVFVQGLNGCRFYYGDQRNANGGPIGSVDGEAHAKLYWELAEDKTQRPWMQTFVKDVGYLDFDKKEAS